MNHFCQIGLTAALILLFGCGRDPSPVNGEQSIVTEAGTPYGAPVSKSIGSAGGTVQSADGVLSLSIPAGALSSNTNITIQPITNEGPLGLGSGYRLEPEGLTFSVPVGLTFTYNEYALKNTPEDFLWIITQAEDGSWNAMLKSVVDRSAKTVTVTTHHFSDWALAKFMDLTLEPSAKSVRRGESVQLKVTGFLRGDETSEDDELVPLTAINTNEDDLTPLTPIPDVGSRLMNFRIKGWTLNGASAPASGSSGSLNSSGNTGTYKAPNDKPAINPVAVSVNLESTNANGQKSSYIITSTISIVESELYLLVTVDGETHEFYQYGFDGTIPADPTNISAANCALEENLLELGGTHVQNSTNIETGFALVIENPGEGTRQLTCSHKDGNDDAAFYFGMGGRSYTLGYADLVKTGPQNCITEYKCADLSVTLFEYEDQPMGKVRGYFSGVLYDEGSEVWESCQPPRKHTIEGEFWLVQAN